MNKLYYREDQVFSYTFRDFLFSKIALIVLNLQIIYEMFPNATYLKFSSNLKFSCKVNASENGKIT